MNLVEFPEILQDSYEVLHCFQLTRKPLSPLEIAEEKFI